MNGSGPAGELTWVDIRRRLAAVAQRAEAHRDRAAELAADEAARREDVGGEND